MDAGAGAAGALHAPKEQQHQHQHQNLHQQPQAAVGEESISQVEYDALKRVFHWLDAKKDGKLDQ